MDDFDLPEELDAVPINIEVIKMQITEYSTNQLCEMIVCDRYFGCYQDVAIICMEELARRRINGDQFAFETHIDNLYNSLPKLDFAVPNIREVLGQVIGNRK